MGPVAGKNHDSTARPSRTPSMRPAPCASHTSRSPRPNRPRPPPTSGSSPSTPRRRSTACAFTPTPSSAQLTSKLQLDSAGARSDCICARHAAMNAASGAPKRNSIRPWPRPPAAIAASALVISSGTIWTRSIPPWAKFSRKYLPRTAPTRTAGCDSMPIESNQQPGRSAARRPVWTGLSRRGGTGQWRANHLGYRDVLSADARSSRARLSSGSSCSLVTVRARSLVSAHMRVAGRSRHPVRHSSGVGHVNS